MTTTAKEAYEQHLAQQKANWSTMTTDQQDSSLRTEKTLQLAAELEAHNNDLEQQAQAEQAASESRANYILHLKAIGYVCDNSQSDWRKAYNKPEWFGANWQSNADAAWAASKGLDDFLNFCRQYNY